MTEPSAAGSCFRKGKTAQRQVRVKLVILSQNHLCIEQSFERECFEREAISSAMMAAAIAGSVADWLHSGKCLPRESTKQVSIFKVRYERTCNAEWRKATRSTSSTEATVSAAHFGATPGKAPRSWATAPTLAG
jgi:hypothetical protein